MLLVTASVTAYAHYTEYPGVVADVEVANRGTQFVEIEWTPARNAESYIVSYGDKEMKVDGTQTNLMISGLEEGKNYEFEVKAVHGEHETSPASSETSTKLSQSIEGKTEQMKLSTTEDIDLGLEAETEIKISAEDKEAVDFSEPGEKTIKAEAVETEDYVASDMEISVEVLDSVSEEPAGAEVHELYHLDRSNCEVVREIKGPKEASIPQSFGYDNGTYYIAYGDDDCQRIVVYGDERTVSKPTISMGHANGLTYSDTQSLCYCVRGNSGRCIVYDPKADEYSAMDLPNGASGIAYDRLAKLFYATSRTGHTVYDEEFNIVRVIAPIRHAGTFYTQDCGGHSGILMHCISGKDKHGINYIDLYDAVNGKYLGSIRCDLDEVESVIVDDDGYLQVLSNTKDETDYIYKTPVNIDDLGKEILSGLEKEEVITKDEVNFIE